MDELVIDAQLENLDAVLAFINERLMHCAPKIRNRIGIAVDEIFSNIARYAYYPDKGAVTVRIAVGEGITLMFEDSGIAYDPIWAAPPDITKTTLEREIGGLGIFMVKNIMDEVQYRREGGRNILIMLKKL